MTHAVPLNPNSPIPLYQQLVERLQAGIDSGLFAVDSKIPSENELAEQYRIGRPTVRQATDTLVRQGLLERRRGSGTFVRPRPKRVDLFSLMGTSAAFASSQVNAQSQLLFGPTLEDAMPRSGNPFDEQPCYHLRRVSRIDSTPVLLEDIFLNSTLFHGLEQLDIADDSLARIAREHYYLTPQSADQTFHVDCIPNEMATALDIRQETPLLKVCRTLHFEHADSAIYSEIYCRTDHFHFSQTITAHSGGHHS